MHAFYAASRSPTHVMSRRPATDEREPIAPSPVHVGTTLQEVAARASAPSAQPTGPGLENNQDPERPHHMTPGAARNAGVSTVLVPGSALVSAAVAPSRIGRHPRDGEHSRESMLCSIGAVVLTANARLEDVRGAVVRAAPGLAHLTLARPRYISAYTLDNPGGSIAYTATQVNYTANLAAPPASGGRRSNNG